MGKTNSKKSDLDVAIYFILIFLVLPFLSAILISLGVRIVDIATGKERREREETERIENLRRIGEKEFNRDYKKVIELVHARNKLIYSVIKDCDTQVTNWIAETSSHLASTNSHYRKLVDELSHKYRRELRKAKYATEKELDKQKENITPANHIEDEDDILSIRCFCD